jgi:hypothetical protein
MWLFLFVLPAAVMSAATIPTPDVVPGGLLLAAAITTPDDLCAPARRAGVNMTSFPISVAHAVHSLSVEDVRYFFDEQFPMENSIPTVNLNLTAGASPVLPYAPSHPSVFKFPGGAAFDLILNNNDQPNKFGLGGLTNLEEIAHTMHMLEMYHMASKQYKDIATNKHINTDQVCPCLVNEQENGIIDQLVVISKFLKIWAPGPIVDGVRRIPRALSHSFSHWYHVNHSLSKRDTEEAKKTDDDGVVLETIEGEEYQVVPELTHSKSWSWWKATLKPEHNDLSRQRMYNLAMYMYCKINM